MRLAERGERVSPVFCCCTFESQGTLCGCENKKNKPNQIKQTFSAIMVISLTSSSLVILASQRERSWNPVPPELKPTGSDFLAECDYSCKRYCLCGVFVSHRAPFVHTGVLFLQRVAILGKRLSRWLIFPFPLLLCFNPYDCSSVSCRTSFCMSSCCCVYLLFFCPPCFLVVIRLNAVDLSLLLI